MKNYEKYKPYPTMHVHERRWPGNVITKAPIWCSVDLRDGNQALEVPMNLEQKLAFFKFLVKIGFKEIEIGFPAASDTEFAFARKLIEDNLIPDDVTIQVLTQSRDHIIHRTFEAVKGAKRVIMHLYNSTSTLQRDVVFSSTKEQTTALAVSGAVLIKNEAEKCPETDFRFEYSPESFTGTEMDFAAEICNAVIDVWKPSTHTKVIINLPSTVEMATANIYADQIEYMCTRLNNRNNIIVSLHAHNDRGTAVAASEFGIMAGADRVEGTLFGNGERTGNTDIMNMALNMFTQGIDPQLDFSKISDAISIYESSTGLNVHPRHPYAGYLVYTAFSGSHQDAIKKGMERVKQHPQRWEVPYLPIDPMDVGRNYDPIIRINSQSGKGGIAFILEQGYGLHLPRAFQQNLSASVTKISDETNSDLSSHKIYEIFNNEYLDIRTHLQLNRYKELDGECDCDEHVKVSASIIYNSDAQVIEGEGNGIMDAFCLAVENLIERKIEIVNYHEHSMEYGTKARAISYVQLADTDGNMYFGAGTSSNIIKSSLRAVVSAVNKMIKKN